MTPQELEDWKKLDGRAGTKERIIFMWLPIFLVVVLFRQLLQN
jgi:hypothetical protein